MRASVIKMCETCNSEFSVLQHDVNRGRGRFCSKSCAASGTHNSAYKHGNATRFKGQTKEYKTWAQVKTRTTNPNSQNAAYYMGRGIKMCDRWLNSFEAFYEDMGPAPTPKHSIDRIDPNGDYEPGNCRWATHIEQMNNIRNNKRIEFGGVVMTQEEWGRVTGIRGSVIQKRLKRGWTVEKALTTQLMRR